MTETKDQPICPDDDPCDDCTTSNELSAWVTSPKKDDESLDKSTKT